MRQDPYMTFRFLLEVNHVQRGGFSRVKGLAREIKTDNYREGGVNDHEHRLATLTTFGNLVLERGLVDDYLWQWQEAAVEGRIERRDVTITVRGRDGAPDWRWLVAGAFPVKWSGTDLDAGSAQVLVESVELAHDGFRKA